MTIMPSPLLPLARRLRQNMTEAEKNLWHQIRANKLHGLSFRRQHPIGRYIADFACIPAMLVVEVDGGQHNESQRDAVRDAYMKQQGWRVLRFWNNQINENLSGILEAIVETAHSNHPLPNPPPPAGEGI